MYFIIEFILKILLGLAGFTATGIKAGSYAALWMAKIGIVTAKSFFSLLQSISMK
jgi:hypothetical protein